MELLISLISGLIIGFLTAWLFAFHLKSFKPRVGCAERMAVRGEEDGHKIVQGEQVNRDGLALMLYFQDGSCY